MTFHEHRSVDADDRMARLQSITAAFSESLTTADVIEAVIKQLVSSFGARAGLVALFDEETVDIRIVRQTGYETSVVDTWRTFPLDGRLPVSDAVREGAPIFLEDGAAFAARYPELTAQIDKLDDGAVALPLLSSGRRIGALYMTYPRPQKFTDDDKTFLMSLAHQCAHALARAQLYEDAQSARAEAEEALVRLKTEVEERRRSEEIASAQSEILEQIAHGKPLDEILTSIACLVDSRLGDVCSSISTFDPNLPGLRLAAGPGLPAEYAEALAAGFPIGPEIGACGTAAFRRQPVLISDIGVDHRWRTARELPLSHGLRACWSTPILGKSNHVLGTFGLFYRRITTEDSISDRDKRFVEMAVHLAGIAIERDRVESGRRAFLSESLAMVTEGHLLLCRSADELPQPRPAAEEILPITTSTIGELRARIRCAARECGFGQARCDDLVTGATEAATNTITHADTKGSAWVHADPSAGRVFVWIMDDGPGIDDDALHHATLERGWTTTGTLGHGFWIILRMIDCTFLHTGESGTTVVLEQKRTPSTPDWMTK